MFAEVNGYKWARDSIRQAKGALYRLFARVGALDLFLKHGRDMVADDVSHEMAMFRWLAGHTSVPAYQKFVPTKDGAWLQMTAILEK